MRIIVAIFLLGFLAEQQFEPVRVNVRLVELSVIVHNKVGDAVTDLAKEDFEILDNGKPQEVRYFALERPTKPSASLVSLPKHVFSNRTLGAVETAPGVSIVLFDLLNTEFTDQSYSRTQLVSLLHKIQPGQRIGVYVLGREVSVLHDFTEDPSQLAAVVARFEGRKSHELSGSTGDQQRPVDLSAASSRFGEAEKLLNGAENVQRDYLNVDRATITLGAFKGIADHLAPQPGRKNLVWISGSFPFTLGLEQRDFDKMAKDSANRERGSFQVLFDSTMRAVNSADLAIYPVDARGLLPSTSYNAGDPSAYSRNTSSYRPPNLDSITNLANKSGGRAFFNTNDVEQAIGEALADGRVSYTLGFYPDSAPDDKFHSLKVQVQRKGVTVRCRQGYFALSQSHGNSDPRTLLQQAVASALDASAIGITVKLETPRSTNDFWGLTSTVDSHDFAVEQQNGWDIYKSCIRFKPGRERN